MNKNFMYFIFLVSLTQYLFADSLLGEKNTTCQACQQNSEKSDIMVFVTSHVIPMEPSFIKDTPYGKMISIPQEALNPKVTTEIMSKGLYNNGNYTIFRSDNGDITFYRHSRNNSNLYARIAPNVYPVAHVAGTFYKVEPEIPKRISKCSIVISRTFEVQKTISPEAFLDLSSVPNRGVADIMLECPKPDEAICSGLVNCKNE